jgi:hypothetical protein
MDVIAKLANGLEKYFHGHKSRGIIFTASVQMAQELEEKMQCHTHYSDQKTVNEINMERWKNGLKYRDDDTSFPQRWIAATPGLINGIDYDAVDAVIFGEEGMAGLFGGVQGTGRGGRGGRPCMCVLVTTGSFNPTHSLEDRSCMKEMKRWTTEAICRRIVPSEVMDGKAVTCFQLRDKWSQTEMCDICCSNTEVVDLIQEVVRCASAPSHYTHIDETFTSQSLSLGPKVSLDLSNACRGVFTQKSSLSVSNHSSSDSSSSRISRSSSFQSQSSTSLSTRSPSLTKNEMGSWTSTASAHPSPSEPGMGVRMNQALQQGHIQQKCQKSTFISKIIDLTRNNCYSCWILRGEYCQAHDKVPKDCGLTIGMGWIKFKQRILQKLPKYHFCYGCGVPQDVSFHKFEPTSHSGLGRSCNFQNALPQMIFALKRSPQIWGLICDEYQLNPQTTDEEFADWVAEYDPHSANYYRGIEILLKFIYDHRVQITPN